MFQKPEAREGAWERQTHLPAGSPAVSKRKQRLNLTTRDQPELKAAVNSCDYSNRRPGEHW